MARSPDFVAIDIGNTQIKFGLMDGESVLSTFRLTSTGSSEGLAEELRHALGDSIIDPTTPFVLASVSPMATLHCREALREVLGVEVLELGRDLPVAIENAALKPAQVGVDRLLNAAAAKARFGSPAIVVDFGTAMTLDVVDQSGAYVGGIISPGLRLSLASLNERTALLPLVELDFASPPILGRDTLTAMQSGVFWGCVGAVKELVGRMLEAVGPDAHVLATGGYAEVIAKEAEVIQHVVPELTLEGMRLSYQEHLRRS
ncbi:MAG: type III pantothenate kinase [Planctomycetes bacterium]|nr:type III pantothenate kinase [Planctomycetota bacterium]